MSFDRYIAEEGATIDAHGKDPASIMKSLASAGLQALNVPTAYGGYQMMKPYGSQLRQLCEF